MIDDELLRRGRHRASSRTPRCAAMVAELKRRYNDRFSHYFGPGAYARFKEVTEGSFSGVGHERHRGQARAARGERLRRHARAGGRDPPGRHRHRGRRASRSRARTPTWPPAEIKGTAGTEVTLTVLRPSTGDERERDPDPRAARGARRRGQAASMPAACRSPTCGCSASRAAPTPSSRRRSSACTRRAPRAWCSTCAATAAGLLKEAVLISSIFVEDGVIVSTDGRTSARSRPSRRSATRCPAPDGRPDQRRHRLGLGDRRPPRCPTPASRRSSARRRSARAPSRR